MGYISTTSHRLTHVFALEIVTANDILENHLRRYEAPTYFKLLFWLCLAAPGTNALLSAEERARVGGVRHLLASSFLLQDLVLAHAQRHDVPLQLLRGQIEVRLDVAERKGVLQAQSTASAVARVRAVGRAGAPAG